MILLRFRRILKLFLIFLNIIKGLEKLITENAVKHIYDTASQKWRKTRVQIKIESEQFAEGCMRRAFKAKTLEGKNVIKEEN